MCMYVLTENLDTTGEHCKNVNIEKLYTVGYTIAKGWDRENEREYIQTRVYGYGRT